MSAASPASATPAPSAPRPGRGSRGDFTVSRWSRSSVTGTIVLAVLAAALFAGPYVFDVGALNAMIDLFIFIVLAATWNLLAGYGGMLSIGQQAYIGLGAYGLVTIADLLGVNPFLSIPLAALVCGVIAIPISYLAFRLVGGYFAIGTWVIAEVIRLIVAQVPQLGAGSGISLGSLSSMDRGLRIASVYWAALAVVVLVTVACVLFARSRRGLALMAVRDDAVAAATSGVYVQHSKRLVFVAAAAGAGAAGALIAMQALRVQPDAVFSVQWSAYMIFIVIVGGVGTLEGPIIGAVVFFALRQLLAPFGPLYLIVLGVIAIAFVLFARRGIWGLITRAWPISLFSVGYRLRSRSGEPPAA